MTIQSEAENRNAIRKFGVFAALGLTLFALAPNVQAQNIQPIRLAILDFGSSTTGKLVAAKLADAIAAENHTRNADLELRIIDRDQSRAAALGIGYRGSLNMTLQEARDLGSAIGCDFFFVGDAQTVRRSPSSGPVYFESYAAIYLVSGRTGRLASWERPSFQRATSEEAERILIQQLTAKDALYRYRRGIQPLLDDERTERALAIEADTPVIEVLSDDGNRESNGVQAPRPYHRLKPTYPETAARFEIEATVDAMVDIDAGGEVRRVEIARWAGYGLDQSVIETVRQLHFFPAQSNGAAIPMRVLLRYNFRKPQVQNRSQ